MGIATFNLQNGYLEGLVRGLRSGFLKEEEYRRLGLCESLEDIRAELEETEYGPVLREDLELTAELVVRRLREHVARDWTYLAAQGGSEAAEHMQCVRLGLMIDNTLLVVQGVGNGRNPEELLQACDPIGMYPELRALAQMGRDGEEELYAALMVGTPIGRYLQGYLSGGGQLRGADVELLSATMKKKWMEDFWSLIQRSDSVTRECMSHTLKLEADYTTLAIALNTLGTERAEVEALLPAMGYLYPEGTEACRKAWTLEQLERSLAGGPYARALAECRTFHAGGEGRALEDVAFAALCKNAELLFEQQCHLGVLYAFLKLKAQEIKNIKWIIDMVLLKRFDQTKNIVPLFAPRV